MSNIIERIMISRTEIAGICERLGKEISADYVGKEVVLVCVLKGAFVFLADLMRQIDVPCEVDFMSVSSYSGVKSTGVVRIEHDLNIDIQGRHVIIVEDIVDSGLTLSYLRDLLHDRNPASIRICTAFDKPDRRKIEIHVDYIGRKIPDEFIVGYGLDYNGKYRNLPDIAILKQTEEE